MGRILNLVANFKNPWINDPVEEAKHITAFKWAPAIDSWEAVIGSRNYIVVESLGTFLGAIEQQKEGAIVRINLWSHGNPTLIAFSGSIDRTTGDVYLNRSNGLDLSFERTDPIYRAGKTTERMGEIAEGLRNRFATGAELWLYVCNSGVDRHLVQILADKLKVAVNAFSVPVWVCPEWPDVPGRPRISRGFTSLSYKCQTKQAGFKHLVANPAVVPRTPSKPTRPNSP